jgi:YgiT-type zinc finger domain-containing protein
MRCDICEEEGVEVTYVDEVHGEGDDMYIIRNVPTYSCPH